MTSPSPSPAEAERMDLPEEIALAMNEAILAECGSRRICSVNGRVTKGIRCGPCERKALETALSRLSAAEAGREEAKAMYEAWKDDWRESYRQVQEAWRGEIEDHNATLARVERLEKALGGLVFYAGQLEALVYDPTDTGEKDVMLEARAALTEAQPKGEQ